jgi:hypothetical protein
MSVAAIMLLFAVRIHATLAEQVPHYVPILVACITVMRCSRHACRAARRAHAAGAAVSITLSYVMVLARTVNWSRAFYIGYETGVNCTGKRARAYRARAKARAGRKSSCAGNAATTTIWARRRRQSAQCSAACSCCTFGARPPERCRCARSCGPARGNKLAGSSCRTCAVARLPPTRFLTYWWAIALNPPTSTPHHRWRLPSKCCGVSVRRARASRRQGCCLWRAARPLGLAILTTFD